MAMKIIIFVVATFVLFAGDVISKRYPPMPIEDCPERCYCRDVDCLKEKGELFCREVDFICFNANVADRLDVLPVNTTRLSIIGENMGHITLDMFSRFFELKKLNLSQNSIRSLKITKAMRFLDFLNLDNNRLCYFPLEEMVKLLPALKILKARHNNLTFLHDIQFPPRLVRLDLSNNHIESPVKGSFRRLKKLEFLNLANNSIREIHPVAFRHLKKLQILDLDRNQITQLLPGSFAHLPSISFLSLRHNRIEFIGQKAFRQIGVRWHGQHQIRLEHNRIKILRKESIDVLFSRRDIYSLYLAGNPIFCDCGMMLIRDTAGDMLRDADTTLCHSPSDLKGFYVGDLDFPGCVEEEEDNYEDDYYDDYY
ncbi:uncharacterized protein LOC120334180 [Styela clava]